MEGNIGIYPFSQDTQTFARLTMNADGRAHIVKSYAAGTSSSSSNEMVSSRSGGNLSSTSHSRVCGLSLVSNMIIEAPGGVKGDSRPSVIIPVGCFAQPLGGWTISLHFKDEAVWDTYLASNASALKSGLDEGSEEYSENIYQNAVWLVKVVRQWLRGIELEREDNAHKQSLHYVR